MPRNAQGVYSLPAGNPVVTGTTIDSTWANPTLSDIASEITASLPRNGAAGMTGELILSGNATVDLAAVPKQQMEAADTVVSEAFAAADVVISEAFAAADDILQGNIDDDIQDLVDHEGATGTSVHGLGTASTLTAQTSTTDVTTNRVLKVGAYGLGSGAAGTVAYGRSNIIGSVSQSGGVPTGAILYSNNYGTTRIERYAHGTQIVTGTMTSSSSGLATFTYPNAFAEAPIVVASVSGAICAIMIGTSASVATFGCYEIGLGSLVAATTNIIAIGKWF